MNKLFSSPLAAAVSSAFVMTVGLSVCATAKADEMKAATATSNGQSSGATQAASQEGKKSTDDTQTVVTLGEKMTEKEKAEEERRAERKKERILQSMTRPSFGGCGH